MKRKKKRKKNKFKPISHNQIIKIDLNYFNEETEENLRGSRYYLVTKLIKSNQDDLLLELLIITTHKQKKFGIQKRFISHYKIIDLPICLPNISFISRPRTIILKISSHKYRYYLCGNCSRFCFSEEEFTRIREDHKEYWADSLNSLFLATINLEI